MATETYAYDVCCSDEDSLGDEVGKERCGLGWVKGDFAGC
jgi:hypothetical protein